MVSGISFTQAVSRDVFDAQVYAQKFFNVLGFGCFNLTGSKEVESRANQHQVTFTPLEPEQFKLAGSGQNEILNRPLTDQSETSCLSTYQRKMRSS